MADRTLRRQGEWLSEESGKSLLQYEGDKILSAIRLDTTQPAPTAAQDVAGLVEALETCRHWFEQNSPAAPLITGIMLLIRCWPDPQDARRPPAAGGGVMEGFICLVHYDCRSRDIRPHDDNPDY
ncbi:hypothetical protein ULG90_24655 [Halopseudomonas pachastrellae]|nr:hypothetical protein ULG90_24655 [Halopseudomonas pachastrellae]